MIYLYKNDIIERTQAVLDCNLSKVIDVIKADYGKPVCMNNASNCYFNAMKSVRKECQDKQRCSFTVTNSFLGRNPCVGVIKQLYVEYECVIKPGTILIII